MFEPFSRSAPQIGADDIGFIRNLEGRLSRLKAIGELESMRITRALPDGGHVTVLDMGGIRKTLVQRPLPTPEDEPIDSFPKSYVPALFSGVVMRSALQAGQLTRLKLTLQARKRLAGYDQNKMAPAEVELERFKIRHHAMVPELTPDPGPTTFTQYFNQRPTWYSGAMAEVVQIAGGYGRQDFDKLPGRPWERAHMELPQNVLKDFEQMFRGVVLPACSGTPPKSGQFQFDYKASQTNLVGFDTEGGPWLLRVRSSGLYAMPLPLVPATTLTSFRDFVEAKGDSELLQILDRFGGMPSGEGFPAAGEAFDAWERAGAIMKVCDVADFYKHIMYTPSNGWSMNARGTEAYNTCYDYDESEGLAYGLTFKLVLRLGFAPGRGAVRGGNIDPIYRPQINAYFAKLLPLLRSPAAKNMAIHYKLRRMTQAQLMARVIANASGEAEVNFLDGLTLDPIATHSGHIVRTNRGWLYHPARFSYQPQFKCPDPFEEQCTSFDFSPLDSGRGKESYPVCDTIMWAYYIGNDLKVIKYFYDEKKKAPSVTDDFEDCMIVGRWTQEKTYGGATVQGNFYLTDIDDRETIPAFKTTEVITGKDLGYDSKPFFAFDEPFSRVGTIWRNRYASRHSLRTDNESRTLNFAVVVPYFCRNAALFAKNDLKQGAMVTETMHRVAVADPNSYRYWTYDSVWYWRGSLPVMTGRPYPKNGTPVWVEVHNHSPFPCSDFADSGDWIGSLPTDYTWLVHPQANVYHLNGGGGAPYLLEYVKVDRPNPKEVNEMKASILPDAVSPVHKQPRPNYFIGNPSERLSSFRVDATRILFGNAAYAVVSETNTPAPGSGEQYVRWGYTQLVDNKGIPHFIGVIDE